MGDLVLLWVCFVVGGERERERKVVDGGERSRVGGYGERERRKGEKWSMGLNFE